MWAIMVVLQLMLPRDSLNNIVSLLSLQGAFTLLLANWHGNTKKVADVIPGGAILNSLG